MAVATNSSAVEMSNIVNDVSSFAKQAVSNPSETMDLVTQWLIKYGLKVLAAVLIFVIGRIVAKAIRETIRKAMTKAKVDPALIHFTCSLAYIGLIAFVVIAALSQLGIQTTSFIAIIGAASLAIGLALQGSLANFAAGVMMLIFKPFKVGDFIEGATVAGVVEHIEIFTTQLKTGDNKAIIIPNAKLTSNNIINYSAKPTRRIELIIGIGYEDDIKKAKDVIMQVVKEDERVLTDPEPFIGVKELADSSVNFVVRPWVKTADYWPVTFALNEQIKLHLDEENISIPYPQQDVHLFQEK